MRRTELPWTTISREVVRAINACNEGRRFVNVVTVAEHIHQKPELYPHFEKCTYQTTQGRVTRALGTELEWERFNRLGGKRAGVFIDPRVKQL